MTPNLENEIVNASAIELQYYACDNIRTSWTSIAHTYTRDMYSAWRKGIEANTPISLLTFSVSEKGDRNVNILSDVTIRLRFRSLPSVESPRWILSLSSSQRRFQNNSKSFSLLQPRELFVLVSLSAAPCDASRAPSSSRPKTLHTFDTVGFSSYCSPLAFSDRYEHPGRPLHNVNQSPPDAVL